MDFGSIFDSGSSSMMEKVLENSRTVGALKRYFQTTQGQHQRNPNTPKNRDLVRMGNTGAGLPTIREDLAGLCDKIELKTTSGKGKSLLRHIAEKLTATQKATLKRLSPTAPKGEK